MGSTGGPFTAYLEECLLGANKQRLVAAGPRSTMFIGVNALGRGVVRTPLLKRDDVR